ncbi:MAG: hypothetical protein HQL41_15110 [Alphaproteobacteria bacterium]|nr:hypothetical protein [Alphaproteobacteria bacterium]
MTEQTIEQQAHDPVQGRLAHLIYMLYLVGIPLSPALVVGAALAFWNRAEGPDWVRSHYVYQIGTFIGTLLFGASALIVLVVSPTTFAAAAEIGAWAIWFVARIIRGMRLAGKGAAHPEPKTWLF